MAWNEPGGNSNNQDPWGGRKKKDGDRQGPPDLDEALRKFQQNLGGLFGKKKTGNGGNGGGSSSDGPGKGSGMIMLLVGLVVVLGIWLYNAIYVVDAQEQAVILRLGKYHETVGAGLHVYFPPFDRKYQENVTSERSYSKTGQMLTEDENIIEVPLTVQYRISDLENFVLKVDQPEVSLQHATDSAVRHVVGSTTMDEALTSGREAMIVEVRERLQRFLDDYETGITVTQVNLQSAQAPREVQEAFDDVIRAREDEQREKNLAESYANGVIPEARGKAQRAIEEATGYRDAVVARAEGEADRFTRLLAEYQKAPEVTRERLYLETMQEVMGNTSKVLVTGDKGQNNLLYLPLDKMVESRGAAAGQSSTSSTPSSVTSAADVSSRTSPVESRSVRTRESR